MSKMEEKLKASIKPRQSARTKPQPKRSSPGKVVVNDADLNASNSPLHPKRIWPD